MPTLIPRTLIGLLLASGTAGAQQPPPVRSLGPVEHTSTEPLASVRSAVPLADGRVYVNDIRGRRLLLFDSTLATFTVVADTTDATANAYDRSGTLIRFRGDSALLIQYSTLSMLVLGPSGTIARVMATPRPSDAVFLLGDDGGPAFDAQRRLVYYSGELFGYTMLGKDLLPPEMRARVDRNVDSGYIVRVDLATRNLDTAATLRISRFRRSAQLDEQGNLASIVTTPDALPVTDGWTVSSDGTIAIVRGRDFHVDWITPDGKMTSTPKMPFEWRRVTDAEKTAAIDTAMSALERNLTAVNAPRGAGRGAGATGRGGGASGRGGGAGSSAGGGGAPPSRGGLAPNVAKRPDASDLPDYFPPFIPTHPNISLSDAVYADVENNLWIRTTTMVNGQPVYDVVNRRGVLIDRLQLPPFRAIAGFGPHVVYLSVQDKAGVVHLERARIK